MDHREIFFGLSQLWHFSCHQANHEAEWVPTASVEFPIGDTKIPWMFLLTKSIAKRAAQGSCTPWEAYLEGGKGTLSTPQLVELADLIMFNKWCIAQCQRKDGKALSSINLCPVQSVDAKCSKWKCDRLNGTMGMPSAQQITSIVGLPSQPPPPGNCTFTQMGNFVHGLTTQFATAVQPIADAQAEVARKKQDAQ